MKNIELAEKYFEVFFETQEFDQLYDIFSDGLDFEGPFLKCTSAREYIESLLKTHWENCSYEILEKYENSNSVCFIYLFNKSVKSVLMSQSFWFADGKICKVRLIFDAATFT